MSGLFAAALTKGVQSHKGRGVTIKHYAANNQEFNRYGNNSIVSDRALRDIYLKGFEICVKEAAPLAVMSSYNLLNGVHTSERKDLLEDILRDEFGFDGVVMTDWIVGDFMLAPDAANRGPRADEIVAAGNDLIMPGSKADVKSILTALKNGKLSRNRLLKNAKRVATLAIRLASNESVSADTAG